MVFASAVVVRAGEGFAVAVAVAVAVTTDAG